MELPEFLDHVNRGSVIEGGSDEHAFMHGTAQEALRVAAEMKGAYRTADEVRALLSELTGKPVDESVTVFPPFYCEFGKNLSFGKDVFINMGCTFQDTGGITIGDGTLIGHGSTVTTLNHGVDPERRADMAPGPSRHRPQGLVRRRRDSGARRDDRRWRHCGCGRCRHQGRSCQFDCGGSPGQGDQDDRVPGLSEGHDADNLARPQLLSATGRVSWR